MKVRIQYRFLFKMLAVLAVIGLMLAGIHRLQVYRNSSQVLTQARKAAENGNQSDAIRYYTQYLKIRFDSVDAQVELADILLKQGNLSGAFLYLEGALRIDPSRIETRKTLVKVAMDLGRHADAKEMLASELVPQDPKNAEYQWLLGICEIRLGEFAKADAFLKTAIELDGRNPIYASSRAELLRDRLNNAAEGRAVLDKLIENAPENPVAFLARGRSLLVQAQTLATGEKGPRDALLESAWQDAQTANRLSPNVPQNVMLLVDVAVAQNRADAVRETVQTAIKTTPGVPELYGSAAQIELISQQPKIAIQILRDGLKAIPGHPDLLFNLCQLELDSGNLREGEELIAELKSRKFEEAPIRYLESRVLVSRGQFRQAATLLEDSRAMFDRSKELLKQADFLISVCYRNLGNPDQEMEALRRAIGADPLWFSARESLANAFLRAGRIQESITEFTQIVNQPNTPISVGLSLARLLFIDGLGRNAQGEDWNPLRQLLERLSANPDAANDLAIMQAELLVVENKSSEAESLLKERLGSDPKIAPLHQALISLQIRNKAWEDAERSLDAAQASLTDSVTVRLERARYLIRRFGKQVDVSQLERLAVPDPGWDSMQKLQLAAGFAGYFLSLEDVERGRKFAAVVADSDLGQTNLSIHLLLFELAFRSNDVTAMNQSLSKVKTIEGTGPLWRVGEAIRLSVDAQNLANASKDSQDAESQSAKIEALNAAAMAQLAEAAVERPSWPRIPRLKGEINDRQGKLDLAVQSYLDAIRLGEQSPQVVSRTILLLFEKGRFVEADEVVRKLQEQKTPFSSELTRVASQVSLELENFDRALSLANDWAIQSDQQEDHVWLAQVHSSSGNFAKAEEEFRIAIAKDRSAPGPWVALVQMFGRLGKTDEASKVIAEAKDSIREKDRDSALGQAYQAIEDVANATFHYKQAMEARSDDIDLMRRYADFCLSNGQEAIAEPILSKLTEMDSTSEETKSWARRALALLIGTRGSDEMFDKARELLSTNLKQYGASIPDDRMLALILSTRPDRSSIAESIKLLEKIAKVEPKFSLTDNFLLANLYQRSNDWSNYSRTMRSVLGNGGASDSRYVRSYAEALVNHGELQEGTLWFDRLKKLAPKDLSTATIEAQLLFRSRDYVRLLKLVESNRSQNEPERMLWAALTSESAGSELTQSGKIDEAKKFLVVARECFANVAKSDPKRTLALAAYHARRGEIKDAVALLQEPNLSVDEVAELIQGALQSGSLKPEDARELIGVVQTVQAKHPRHVMLNVGLGDLWSWLTVGTEATIAYKLALQADPNNIPVLNNLSMVMALTGQPIAEATRYIEHAVSVVGPTDYLLDTRCLVHLTAGNLQAAEQDIRIAIEVSPRADRFFHLAQVLQAQGRSEEARIAIQKAKEGGVTVEALHPLERKAFETLVKQK